jgi:enoyl-[acyl-carrier protein] reductase III
MTFSNTKTALVSGGTRGIGKSVSLQLAREGYHVFALYGRNREAAEGISRQAESEGIKVTTVRGDLTHPEKFQILVEEVRSKTKRIDCIVHCAASGVHRSATELSAKHISWTMDINVISLHRIIQSFVDLIPDGGRIIGITSSGGTRVIPYYAAVGASKGALESLLRHYAAELAPKGIAVNCVCPGLVMTEAVEAFPDKEARVEKTISATPSGKLTTPEDVANVVSFLCSTRASQIIGQTITIDGGKTLSS